MPSAAILEAVANVNKNFERKNSKGKKQWHWMNQMYRFQCYDKLPMFKTCP